MNNTLRIALRDPQCMPTYATPGSVGLDIMAAIESPLILEPGQTLKIPCGFSMELPLHLEAQIRPRSGLAAKHGLTILNSPGTIDPDYRGEVCVLLHNTSSTPFKVEYGMRIAQMVIAAVKRPEIILASENDLSVSKRQEKGFGSSGI